MLFRSVLGFSKVMKYLFETHEVEVKFLFIGLMAGTLPSVFNQANKKGFKITYMIPFALTFGGTLLAMLLESSTVLVQSQLAPDFLMRGLFGIIIGMGTIIPGISSSFMLMTVGGYELLLDGIVNFDIPFMVPVVMGFSLSILIFAKIINFLFKKLYGVTYYGILGFVLGSILMIAPPMVVWMEVVVGFSLCIVGFLFSFKLNKLMV